MSEIRICKIKYINHPVLKNLELDFTSQEDVPYNNIVFVGNNGCGKTQVLQSLHELCAGKAQFECDFQCFINGKLFDLKLRKNLDSQAFYITDETSTKKYYSQSEMEEIGLLSLFSKVDIGYTTQPVQEIGSSMLDNNKNSRESTSATSTELKRLLIDIHHQDASDISTYVFEHDGNILHKDDLVNIVDIRRNRFNEAFSAIFNDIEFYKVEAKDNQQRVLFKKNNSIVEIDSLSSGEKQIVFRGAFFLRDKKLMDGAITIIDEPEISMHPSWQTDILKYYQKIVINKHGIQSQMFVATHSEYVVKTAMDENTKIIALSREDSEIKATIKDKSFLLPILTISEIRREVFGIFNYEYHDYLYSYIEEKLAHEKNNSISQPYVDNLFKEYIKKYPNWNSCQLKTINKNTGKEYFTLPVAIRNHSHHPYNGYDYSYDNLQISTLLLEEFIKKELAF